MGLKDEPFVVADTVSVGGNIYSAGGDLIFLEPNEPTTVATVDVCIKQLTSYSCEGNTQINCCQS